MSILAQIFDDKNSLSKLENFVSINGSQHYNLEQKKKKIRLTKLTNPLKFKTKLRVNDQDIAIFNPNFDIYWKVLRS